MICNHKVFSMLAFFYSILLLAMVSPALCSLFFHCNGVYLKYSRVEHKTGVKKKSKKKYYWKDNTWWESQQITVLLIFTCMVLIFVPLWPYVGRSMSRLEIVICYLKVLPPQSCPSLYKGNILENRVNYQTNR